MVFSAEYLHYTALNNGNEQFTKGNGASINGIGPSGLFLAFDNGSRVRNSPLGKLLGVDWEAI